MKQLLILFGGLLFCMQSFSMSTESIKKIFMKGKTSLTSSNSVEVTIGADNTLTTTFNKDMDNVTITVKKQSGEVISVENMDAKEWDTCPTRIPNYKEGEYKVEISTPEGELEGNF